MWEHVWTRLLKEEVKIVVASSLGLSELREIVSLAINRTAQGSSCAFDGYRQSLLPIKVYYSIRGGGEAALPVAAAYHLLLSAADVFDDIEDADSPYSLSAKYGAAIAINAATTLVIIAEKAVARLNSRGVPDRVIVQVMDVLNSYYATACTGQHLDLSSASKTIVSEDEYFRIASMKSASQSKCACHIGALSADADQKLVAAFSEFGYHLGMASQIANDIQGIIDGSDIFKPKVSLPMVYALNHADAAFRETLESAFNRKSCLEADIPRISKVMFDCGAMHYAMIRVEDHKQRAKEILDDLDSHAIRVNLLRTLA